VSDDELNVIKEDINHKAASVVVGGNDHISFAIEFTRLEQFFSAGKFMTEYFNSLLLS
jgi:hypothetical protein